MANEFLKTQRDELTNITTISMKKSLKVIKGLKANFWVNFRHHSSDENTILIDLEFWTWQPLDLYNGHFYIKINDENVIELTAIDHSCHVDIGDSAASTYYWESDLFKITKEDLKQICEAHTIKFFFRSNFERDAEANEFIQFAQRFYNGAIDENAYKEQVAESNSKNGCLGSIIFGLIAFSALILYGCLH